MIWSASALLRWLGWSLAVGFIALFLVMTVCRLAYPYEVAWLESEMYAMMRQRLLGEPIYAPPSLWYTPCLYPPFYFDLSAWVAWLLDSLPFGWSRALPLFLPLRLVSTASALGVFFTTFALLKLRQRRSWTVAFLGASIWLAMNGRWECWLDSSRVDSLFTLLLLVATTFLFEGRGVVSALVAGLFAGLATVTKQPAIVLFSLALVVAVWTQGRMGRAALIVVIWSWTTVGYLLASGHGREPLFFFWIFEVPASHAVHFTNLLRGARFLLLTLSPCLAWAVLACLSPRREGPHSRLRSAWGWTGLAWLVALLVLRAKDGASENFFMPLCPVLVLAATEGVARFQSPSRLLSPHTLLRKMALLFPVVQLAMLVYDPRPFLPTPQAVAEATSLIEVLRRAPRDVWFPPFPSYAAFAGKAWVAHQGALEDLRTTVRGPGLAAALRELPASRAFGMLIPQPSSPLISVTDVAADFRRVPWAPARSRFLMRLHDVHVSDVLYLEREPPPTTPPSLGR